MFQTIYRQYRQLYQTMSAKTSVQNVPRYDVSLIIDLGINSADVEDRAVLLA